MNNVEQLTNQLREDRNPAKEIGVFLMSHSNSPEYLLAHLRNFVTALEADIEARRIQLPKLS